MAGHIHPVFSIFKLSWVRLVFPNCGEVLASPQFIMAHDMTIFPVEALVLLHRHEVRRYRYHSHHTGRENYHHRCQASQPIRAAWIGTMKSSVYVTGERTRLEPDPSNRYPDHAMVYAVADPLQHSEGLQEARILGPLPNSYKRLALSTQATRKVNGETLFGRRYFLHTKNFVGEFNVQL